LLPREAVFPGYAALVPVLGTVLLLYGGHRPQGTLVQRLLSARQWVNLGGLSFALYLWHWPVLVFTQHVHGIQRFNLPQGLLVIGLSLLLAGLGAQLVEAPWRRRVPRSQPARAFLLGVAALLPGFGVWVAGKHLILQAPESVAAAGIYCDEPLSYLDNARELQAARLVRVQSVQGDLGPAAAPICDKGMVSAEVILCAFGDLAAEQVVALVGGSHSSQWAPAFSELGRRYGFRLISITLSVCSLGYQPMPWRGE